MTGNLYVELKEVSRTMSHYLKRFVPWLMMKIVHSNIRLHSEYRDQIPKSLAGLKSRLRQAWRNIPRASLRELLASSMLQRLKNVIQKNGGHAGY